MSWAERRAALLKKPEPTIEPETVKVALACLIAGCTSPAVDAAYCAEHRRMADDGSLWLRCVFCGAPVAPNDPIACAGHRAEMEATV